MKKSYKFRDSYEVTDDDLQGVIDNVRQSDDDIVVDAIERGRRFVGFEVTQTSATAVNVAAGRLWFDGRRHYEDVPGGVALDLLPLKPNLQKKVVAIVAWPETVETDLEERDYETDAETGVKEPRSVKLNDYRHARLEAVGGAESVSPLPPVIVATAVVIAHVRMGTAGIEGITRNAAALLRNLGDVADRVDDLEDWRDEVSPQISTIATELSRIAGRLGELGNQELAYALAQDVAEIKEKLDLPAAYVNYRAEDFLDLAGSDTTAGGYSAKVEEGLRFAPDAIWEGQLQIFNPYNPDVVVSGSGLMLPKYEEISVRIVKGGVGELALAQYAYETRTSVVLSMTRSRVRYGEEFEVSAGSAWWQSGRYSPVAIGASIFAIGNETFQVYETGRVDPDGHKIYRLSKFWQDSLATPYWSRITTDVPVQGYAWVETFLQPRDAWLTKLAPRVSRKPADGLLHVGICETKDGAPDLDRTLFLANAPATHWLPEGGLGSNQLAVPQTFMQGGSRKGFVLMTAAAYYVQQVEQGTAPTTGTMFYGVNGGVFHADPARHIMFDAYYATFPRNRIEVDLQSLSLAGGIAAIDITAEAIVPESCSLTYQVQIGGVWKSLEETSASHLSALPPLVPLRAVMTGTPDVMPGLRLSGSRVRISRPKTTLKHVSTVATLGASSSTIKVKTRLRNFDAAHHSCTVKILTGVGYATVETADSVVDVVRGAVTERTATFNLAGAVTSYKRQIEATTDSAANLFVIDSAVDVAT